MHHFDVEVAQAHGVNAAFVAENIRFWIRKHKAEGEHSHEGRTWAYASNAAMAKLFPYLSPKQIRVAVNRLATAGERRCGREHSRLPRGPSGPASEALASPSIATSVTVFSVMQAAY